MVTAIPKVEMFEINVRPGTEAGQLRIMIDGEETVASGFEFAAPIGTGLLVRKVVRVELEPSEITSERERFR